MESSIFCVQKKKVALSKHVNNYGSQSGFPYYNLTTPHWEGSSYPPPGKARAALWVWAMWTVTNTHQS